MALTCLRAMTSSSSPQTVCRAGSKSGEIPPEGLMQSRGPRCSALVRTRVSRRLPKTFRPSQLVLEIGFGAANDTRRRPANVTGSGVCNWSRSVSQMPLVSQCQIPAPAALPIVTALMPGTLWLPWKKSPPLH